MVANPGNPPAVVEDPANTPCPPKPEKEIGAEPKAPVFEKAIDTLYQEVALVQINPELADGPIIGQFDKLCHQMHGDDSEEVDGDGR